jgi:L-aspartate oxidase
VNRYLTNFDTGAMPVEHYDAVIIGSGIAGVYTALQMDANVKVAIVTKETLDISNSVLAQGGIAVSLDKGDSPKLHFQDTLYAGAGLCDDETVWALVNEAAENIETLCRYGVNFDRTENHQLAFTREAAHSKNRIIHTGDATGKEVCDTLIHEVLKCDNVQICERTFAVDILTDDKTCRGLLVYDEDAGTFKYMASVVTPESDGKYKLRFTMFILKKSLNAFTISSTV